jgi:hypothetical protein
VTRRDVQFKVGELVWVYLPKELFPRGEYHKLKQRNVGPCEILEKFGANVYRVKLPDDLYISNTFNVSHFHKYYTEDTSLRASFKQPGEPNAMHILECESDLDEDGNFRTINEIIILLENLTI